MYRRISVSHFRRQSVEWCSILQDSVRETVYYPACDPPSYTPLTPLQHLLDPSKFAWYNAVPACYKILPEISNAKDAFMHRKWVQCDISLEASLRIMEGVLNRQGVTVTALCLGRLLTAMHRQLHNVQPERWISLCCEIFERLELFDVVNSADFFQATPFLKPLLAIALLVPGVVFSSYMQDCIKKISSKPVDYKNEVEKPFEFYLALNHPHQNIKSTVLKLQGHNDDASKSGTDGADALLHINPLHVCGVLLEELNVNNSIRMIWQPQSLSAEQNMILRLLHSWIHRLYTSAEKNTLKCTSGEYITICLSVPKCPLEILQHALKLSKGMMPPCNSNTTCSGSGLRHTDSDPHAHLLLTSLCLRRLAYHYQFNYVYLTGLFTTSASHLEKWVANVPNLCTEERNNFVNHVVRRHHIRLLEELGQEKEAQALKRKYNL